MSDSEQQRALVVAAHPDDIEYGGAGTFAKWVQEGWHVEYVLATRGQMGGQDHDVEPHVYGKLREAEAREAARVAGIAKITFLDYMDSQVEYTLGLQRDIAREFRRVRPHRLVTMNPEQLPNNMFTNHPDHRRVARATIDVNLMAGTTNMIFPELARNENLQAWHDCAELWLMGPAGGEEVVDVSDTIEIKLAALAAHVSQDTQSRMDFIRQRLADIGAAHGYAYAEAFRVIRRLR